MEDKKKVLFICNHNAGRSQMAEAILNHRYGDRYKAFSAGINPSESINSNTVEVLKEVGIDVSDKKPKGILPFLDDVFDVVAMTCECGNTCPMFPRHNTLIKVNFKDPYHFSGSKEEILKGFRDVREDISDWIDEYFKNNS